jgi:hypothetical protein
MSDITITITEQAIIGSITGDTSTAFSGLLKASAGKIAQAVEGVDYAPANVADNRLRFDAPQTLTTEERTQLHENIAYPDTSGETTRNWAIWNADWFFDSYMTEVVLLMKPQVYEEVTASGLGMFIGTTHQGSVMKFATTVPSLLDTIEFSGIQSVGSYPEFANGSRISQIQLFFDTTTSPLPIAELTAFILHLTALERVDTERQQKFVLLNGVASWDWIGDTELEDFNTAALNCPLLVEGSALPFPLFHVSEWTLGATNGATNVPVTRGNSSNLEPDEAGDTWLAFVDSSGDWFDLVGQIWPGAYGDTFGGNDFDATIFAGQGYYKFI